MIIVTGGAGFIGSAVVWALNRRGTTDILVVDTVDHDEKEHNLAPLRYSGIVSGTEFREKLRHDDYNQMGIEAVFHQAAITSTTETNWELFADVNIAFSQEVIRWCVDRGVRCVYVSSAAVYGDGSEGYSDNHDLFDELQPLNFYGKSKLMADVWARDGKCLDRVAGLRYFNVFGPNEWHKGDMGSVVMKKFEHLQKHGVVELFKSYNPDYKDGESTRDFIYVKDAVDATLFFLDNPDVNGIFNVGTGKARMWIDLARAMFMATGKKPNIRYVEMPENLRDQYQYFTEADITKLKNVGYTRETIALEDAVDDYIQNHLAPHLHLGTTVGKKSL